MFRKKTRMHAMLDKVRLSQRMIAEELQVDPPSVSAWVSLKRMPRKDKLVELARMLQVDLGYLTALFVADEVISRHGPEISRQVAQLLAEDAQKMVPNAQ